MPSSFEPGDIVGGKYRVERLLGEGGMGLVYAATNLALEQRVAIKLLRDEAASKPEAVERFTREARAAARIQSQHVARVLDIAFLESGAPYIVMEYLDGEDLAQVVARDGPLAIEDVVRHTLAACEALAEVHAQGMIHRDLKPSNLFLALRADGTRDVKVLDFGISKKVASEAGGAANPALTRTAAVLGSPRYMSPEQLRSARDVDARSDIWALGVTLFELLSGAQPFATGTLAEVCAAILKDQPTELATVRADLPFELCAVVHRCLEKDPDARFADLAELAAALAPFGPASAAQSVERVAGVLARTPPPVSGEGASADAGTTELRAAQETARPPVSRAGEARPRGAGERTGEILARLGDRSRVLRVAVERDAISGLDLEPRAAFLLSRVDGSSTVDDVLDVCGMPQGEALEVLDLLLNERLIVIDASPSPR
jgi:eukaryotic-like serine/threonine-protein kinase